MEEIKKIEVQGQQYGVADMLMRSVMGGNAQVIEWSHTHNMNDYKTAGTYRIKGERTGNPLSDNLPIMNSGSGHTIDGILYVLDSSLTNGSGKEDDCTITQFLMLSNRVGGQEGDMYMRSAYGANKDSLTWKPWEKYQTNMEVGVVTEGNTMNPHNPTQVLKYGYGMIHLTDNGIYSGVYLGPKTMIGTTEDPYTIVINDPTAIETFVMVVINNYAAASNARCVTQIKFAVTNGGVFSMEKRSTTPGGIIPLFSQWESVGGSGLPEGVVIGEDTKIGEGTNIGSYTSIGDDVIIENSAILNAYVNSDLGIGNIIIEPNSVTDNNFKTRFVMEGSDINFTYTFDGPPSEPGYNYVTTHINSEFNLIEFTSTEGGSTIELRNDNYFLFSKKDSNDTVIKRTKLPYGLTIEPSEDGSKLVFSYNGKTAELPLA